MKLSGKFTKTFPLDQVFRNGNIILDAYRIVILKFLTLFGEY